MRTITDSVMQILHDLLAKYENCKLNRHLVEGVPHIGYGHNLSIQQTPEELEILGITTNAEVVTIVEITQDQAEALLRNDIQDAVEDADILFGDDFFELTDTRQAVALSMFFQCGLTGIRKFKKFGENLRAKNYAMAAVEMLDSEVARKEMENPKAVPRWQDQAFAMEHDYFPWEAAEEEEDVEGLPDPVLHLIQDLQERVERLEEAMSEVVGEPFEADPEPEPEPEPVISPKPKRTSFLTTKKNRLR